MKYAKTKHRYFVDKVVLTVIPLMEEMVGFYQYNPNHNSDLFEHTMRTVCSIEGTTDKDMLIKVALLLHDTGKLSTFKMDKKTGIGHFYGHPKESEVVAKTVMRMIRFTSKEKEFICKMVVCHDLNVPNTEKGLLKLARKLGGLEYVEDLIKIKIADDLGKNLDLSRVRIDNLREAQLLLHKIMESKHCLVVRDLRVNGADIMEALQIKPGKLVGELLNHLLEKVVDGEVENSREALLELVRQR